MSVMEQAMFRTGDRVRLKTGNSPQTVLEIRYSVSRRIIEILCCYDSDREYDHKRRWRDQNDYVLIFDGSQEDFARQWSGEYEPDQPKETKQMTELFQTKDEPARFGTFLAHNSSGQLVLEMKGEGGKVEAFDPEQIEVVTPYTIQLTKVAGSSDATSTHVLAVKGQVEVDQLLIELNSGTMWRVTQLDSKSRNPKTNKSKWLMVPSTKITFGESENDK